MTTETPTTTADPMDAAMSATERPQERTYFGQIATVDCWYCILEKGVGKRPYDPTRDAETDRRTAIKLQIACAGKDGVEYTVDQDCMDFENSWLKHTLPSLRALNVSLRQLKGAFVQIRRVPTGEKYTNKQSQVKEKTAIEFVAIYPDRVVMQTAADLFYKTGGRLSSPNTPRPVEEVDLPDTSPASVTGNAEQDFALKSLPALWKAAGHDAEKFKTFIASNPMINKHYPITHPQVVALMSGAITEAELTGTLPF